MGGSTVFSHIVLFQLFLNIFVCFVFYCNTFLGYACL